MSKHVIARGSAAELLICLAELKGRAQARTDRSFPVVVIQEAGLNGFWIHRVLPASGTPWAIGSLLTVSGDVPVT